MTFPVVDFRTVLAGLLWILLLSAVYVPAQAGEQEARVGAAESEIPSASGAAVVPGGQADSRGAESAGPPA